MGLLAAFLAGFVLLFPVLAGASERSVRFVFMDKTHYPNVRIEYHDGLLAEPVTLTKEQDGKWSHTVELASASWAVNPSFVIHFDREQGTDWPIDFKPFSIGLPLHITKVVDDELVIPVYLFTKISNDEMERLERLKRRDQVFERRMLSEQIAKHYISVFSSHRDSISRRAIANWFDSALSLTKYTDNLFTISHEAGDASLQAYEGDASTRAHYQRHVEDAASLFWSDVQQLNSLIDSGLCDEARSLVKYVRLRHLESPESYLYRLSGQDPDAVLAERERRVSAGC